MYNSWQATREGDAHLVLYVADDDPLCSEYQALFKDAPDMTLVIDMRLSVVDVFNTIAVNYWHDFEYFNNINDDHVYITKGWDIKLIDTIKEKGNGWGIACPNDKLHDDWNEFKHPSGEVVSGNIIKTLGHCIWPKFKHLGADIYLKNIGLGIDRLFYVPEVIIEHRHAAWGKGEMDENYRSLYSHDNYDYRHEVILQWVCFGHKDREINKLKTAIMVANA